MVAARVVVCITLAVGCGRLGFEVHDDAAVVVDAAGPDAAPPPFFVTELGTNQVASAANNGVSIGVATAVPAGRRVMVAFTPGSQVGVFVCSDARGNNYTIEATGGGGGTTVAVACSTIVTNPLAVGDTVSASYPSFSGTSVTVAVELAPTAAAPLDQLVVATANNSAPGTGSTGQLNQADEILVAIVYWDGQAQLSSLAMYTAVGSIDSNAGTYTRNIVIGLAEAVQIGAYSMSGKLTAPAQWKAMLLTYPR